MATDLSDKNDTFIVEPWMTELLAWANEFGYYKDVLPRNRHDLKNKIELFYNNKQIISLPENIVQIPASLNNLKNIITLEVTLHDDNPIPKSLYELSCDLELQIYSKQKKLPDSLIAQLADLKSLTGLTINNDYLTELPESIFKFEYLRKLVINASKLKQIPETIGHLTGLIELTIKCKALERLPKSLTQLAQLRLLDVPSQLFSQLPPSFIDKYRNDEIDLRGLPISALYRPLADDYSLSEFGFFLTDDDWDEKSLLDLKYKTGAHFLFGLQTTDQRTDKLDVIDGIIICKTEEVQQVMKVSEAILSARGRMVAMDYGDIRRALQFTKPAHFIQTFAIGMDKLDRAERAGNQLISQIPKDISIKNMIIRIKSDCVVSLDEMVTVDAAVKNRITEDKEVWYDIEVIDKLERCWIEAIYMVE